MIGTEQGSSLQSLTVAGLSAHWAAIPDDGDIQSYQKMLDPQDQCYSSMLSEYDFIRMGIAILFNCPRSQRQGSGLFYGIDYPAFFKDFSDREVFEAWVMLHQRITENLSHALCLKRGWRSEQSELWKSSLSCRDTAWFSQLKLKRMMLYRPFTLFGQLLLRRDADFCKRNDHQPNYFYCFYRDRTKPYLEWKNGSMLPFL